MKKAAPSQPIVFTRADPAALALFDPSTRRCMMNCGPHAADPRSGVERKFLCDECLIVRPAAQTQILKSDGEISYLKTFTIGTCPHCRQDDALVVCDVERDGYEPVDWPSAVHCGSCGARGPWGKTEETALAKWNETAGITTVAITDWCAIPPASQCDDENFPF